VASLAYPAGSIANSLSAPYGLYIRDADPDATVVFANKTPAELRSTLESTLQRITVLEQESGPYSPDLVPDLRLGAEVAESSAQHELALNLLKRAIQLLRITEGLTTPEQYPLIESELRLHQKLGHSEALGGRLRYLHDLLQAQGDAQYSDLALDVAGRWLAWHVHAAVQGASDRQWWTLYEDSRRYTLSQCGEPDAPTMTLACSQSITMQLYVLYVLEHSVSVPVEFPLGTMRPVRQTFPELERDQRLLNLVRRAYVEGKELLQQYPVDSADLLLADWHWYHDKRDAAETLYRRWQEDNRLDAGAPIPDFHGLERMFTAQEELISTVATWEVDDRGRFKALVETLPALSESEESRLRRRLRQLRYRPGLDEAGAPMGVHITRAVVLPR
jgi:hypothetical protein